MPLLSIILPVKNDDPVILGACFESLNCQTFKDFELIIVDDSSESNTIDILNSFKADFSINIIRGPRIKAGLPGALNKGILSAKGQFIARLDADDIQNEHRFEKQLNFLFQNPKIMVVGCNTDIIDQTGNIIGEKTFPENNSSIKRWLSVRNTMSHPTLMFRRIFFDIVGLYNEDLKRAEDYSLWLKARAFDVVKFHNLQDKLVSYRISNINKRDRLNWKINLKLKIEFFKWEYFLHSIFGLFIVMVFLIIPNKLKHFFYKRYATW